MLVTQVWPDCTYRNGEWHHDEIPAFWVGVSVDERETVAASTGLDLDPDLADPDGTVFLLVARDLSSVAQHPFFYPMSGQWVAGSPFRPVEPPISIEALDELPDLPV